MSSLQKAALPQSTANNQPGGEGGSEQQSASSSPSFEQSLQRQIADALQPVLSTFQQRVVDSIRQQIADEGEEGGQPHEQVDPSESQALGSSGLEAALHRSAALLKQSMDRLVSIVRLVVDTVSRWLAEVVALLRRIAVSAILKIVKAIVRPLVKVAIGRIANGLEQQGKQKLAAVGQ